MARRSRYITPGKRHTLYYVPTSSCAIHPSSPLVEISPKSSSISILYITSLSLLLAPNFDLYCPQRALCCVRTTRRLEEAFCFLLCSLSTFLAWVFTRARPLVGFWTRAGRRRGSVLEKLSESEVIADFPWAFWGSLFALFTRCHLVCDLNDLWSGIYRQVRVCLKSALIYFDFRGREIEGDRVLFGEKKSVSKLGKWTVPGIRNSPVTT